MSSATRRVRPAKRDVINTFEGIISYDEDNLYPNTFSSIIDRSHTAQAVLAVAERFVYGKGMTESGDFWKKTVNIHGLRVDQLARRIIQSYIKHRGFALHFNYNELFEKTSVKIVPFEFCRVGKPDDENYSGKIIVYDKWKTTGVRKDRIKTYNAYNPDPKIVARQIEIAGGIDKYKGQIWYFGENGEKEYPLNPFHAVKNEMIAEILISEGKNSNASNNFLASQMFVLPGTYKELSPYPEDQELQNGETTRFEEELRESIGSLQGASNMGAVIIYENNIKDKDNNPVKLDVVKFDVQNFDKIHEYTEISCENSIIKIRNVPHILIKPTATGFSTEILDSYYQFYNEVTAYDRQVIEEVMAETFKNWETDINPSGNYSIKPLTLTIAKDDKPIN